MNLYDDIPTPPASEDAEFYIKASPPYPYILGETISVKDLTAPHLVITEQPIGRFRFRYRSEMAGTHGSLCGANSDRSRKQTYPTVKLVNYNKSEAIIRCTLYQHNVYGQDNMPHAHRLVKKVNQQEKDDPHDIAVAIESDYTASFHSMGIIHTAKKNIIPELVKKKRLLRKEENARMEGKIRELTKAEEVEIKLAAEEESRNINLNIVCLKFEAFKLPKDNNGILDPICEPVFSEPINNLKSALTGELKIVRMDHCTSSCKGNKEIFILVEKVTKKNIKIRFFEEDQTGQEIWEAYGKFSDLDVHHQYAIVFKTPPYKHQDITRNVKVLMELVRPSDMSRSEPKEFTYLPLESVRIGRKRPRLGTDSISYTSGSLSSVGSFLRSSELPATLPNMSTPTPMDINSEDIAKIINDLLPAYQQTESVQGDGNARPHGSWKRVESTSAAIPSLKARIQSIRVSEDDKFDVTAHNVSMSNREIEDKYKNQCFEACRKLVTLAQMKPKKEAVQSELLKYFDPITANYNPLHVAVYMEQKPMVTCLLKIIKACGEERILSNTNEEGETPLHLAAEIQNPEIVRLLVDYGADRKAPDAKGNAPLHVAVQGYAPSAVIHALLDDQSVDLENNEGDTPLNVAIEMGNLSAVKELLKRGADVNKPHKKSGYTPLRQAVEKESSALVQSILDSPSVDVLVADNSDVTPIQSARVLRSEGSMEASKVYDILEEYMCKRSMPVNVTVKEEESSDEEMDVDLPESAAEVKLEPMTADELAKAYEDVKEFTPIALDKVCDILDRSGTWEDLAKLLDLDCMFSTDLLDNNPSKHLLNMALVNGDSLFQIRNFLENLDELEAVKVMDVMVTNK